MDFKRISIVSSLVFLLLGIGIGQLLLTSRINSLNSELEWWKALIEEMKADNEQSVELIEELALNNRVLLDQYEDLQANYSDYRDRAENNYTLLRTTYMIMWNEYDQLIKEHNELIKKFDNSSLKPVGKITYTEIPGIYNGKFINGTLGWIKHGSTRSKGGVSSLLQTPSRVSSFAQLVFLNSTDIGIVFWAKANPIGGEVILEVVINDIKVFSKSFAGSEIDFDWEEIVIPLEPIFKVREYYGFETDDIYMIQFMVPIGNFPDAQVSLDNVTLARIEYEPYEPNIG